MSYVRQRKPIKIASFDVVSQASGRTIGQADDAAHVVELAEDYRANPEIMFIGIDESGYQVQTWTLGEVLNGTFEGELSA
jgi:hypothetical protein